MLFTTGSNFSPIIVSLQRNATLHLVKPATHVRSTPKLLRRSVKGFSTGIPRKKNVAINKAQYDEDHKNIRKLAFAVNFFLVGWACWKVYPRKKKDPFADLPFDIDKYYAYDIENDAQTKVNYKNDASDTGYEKDYDIDSGYTKDF